jgi:hypothetical protein
MLHRACGVGSADVTSGTLDVLVRGMVDVILGVASLLGTLTELALRARCTLLGREGVCVVVAAMDVA